MTVSFVHLARVGALVSLTLMAACATASFGPPTVSMRVTSNIPDATVWVDDHLVAPAAQFAKGDRRLSLGFHRVEVRAPGYYSYFEELEAKPNTPVIIAAPLHELLD